MAPEISIIVPVYNVDKYLKRCIESIMNQTFKNYELLLINDGSTDESGLICDYYAKINDKIKVLHQKNSGAPTARNNGLDKAVGKYVLFIDSDDYIHPKMLEILYGVSEEYNSDITVCDFKTIDDEKVEYEAINNYSVSKTNNIKLFDMMLTRDTEVFGQVLWNKLFKRNVIGSIRMTPEYIIDDFDFVYRVLYNCKNIVQVDKKLYYYYSNSNSIMNNSRYNAKKVLVLDAWRKMALTHKSYGYVILYNKAMDYYVRAAISILDKAYNEILVDKEWIEYSLKHVKNNKCHIFLSSKISMLSKVKVLLATINFKLAKKIHFIIKHK